jgi:2-phospho-L-lactate guanylyltransferase
VTWSVVLPLKGGPAAKSRLRGLPAVEELAHALAMDCLDAVLACTAVHRVTVVTTDPVTAATARAAGAQVVAERLPGAGLVPAVLDGVRGSDPGRPAAVLLGDLPALRPEDLAAALGAAAGVLAAAGRPPMAVVPDAELEGSVLLAAARPGDLDPAFGSGSLREHERRGAVRLEVDLPRLRRDVDTPADLRTALALGCGPRTTAWAAHVTHGEVGSGSM